MRKSVAIVILAIALGVTAWLLPVRGERAMAVVAVLILIVIAMSVVVARAIET